jgi:hypothetical protein
MDLMLGEYPLPVVAPPTTIPCFCWSSPGFKEEHSEAYKHVQRDMCNYDSECMRSAEAKNLINYRALERGGHLCREKYDPCCRPSQGEESCPGGKDEPSQGYVKYAALAAGALVIYLALKRRRK